MTIVGHRTEVVAIRRRQGRYSSALDEAGLMLLVVDDFPPATLMGAYSLPHPPIPPCIQVWTLRFDNRGDDQNFQEFLYSLEGHSRSVNVVRFSPSGR